jgi:hypothetical protein
MASTEAEDIVMWSGGKSFRIPKGLVQKLTEAGFAVGEVSTSPFKLPYTPGWQTTKGLKYLTEGYQVMKPVIGLLDDAQKMNYEQRFDE